MFHILSLCILLPRCQWIYIFYSWDWRSCDSGISSSRFSYVRFRVPKAHTMSCTCIDLSYLSIFILFCYFMLLHPISSTRVSRTYPNKSSSFERFECQASTGALYGDSLYIPRFDGWLYQKGPPKKTIGVHCHLSTVHLRNFCSPLNVYWFETSILINISPKISWNFMNLHLNLL